MCAQYLGNRNAVGFFYESGLYANPTGTTLQSFGLVQSHEPDENENIKVVRYSGQGNRNVGMFVRGAQDYSGKISYYPQDWKMLGFFLGSVVDSSNTHTMSAILPGERNAFTSGTKQPPMSFTIEDSQNITSPTGLNFVRTLKGCVVDTFDMTIAKGEIVKCDVGYIAQSETFSSGTASTLTVSSLLPYVWDGCKLHIPSGTVITNDKDIKFSGKNNSDAPHYCDGTRTIASPVPLNLDFELTTTLDSDAALTKTIYTNYWQGGSSFNVLLEAVMSNTGSIYISMSGCRLMDMEAPSPIEGVNEQSITIQPQSVTAIARDTIASYNPW